MNSFKKSLKFIIGIGVLLMTLILFTCSMRSGGTLESGALKDWRNAPTERRMTALKAIVAADTDYNLLCACVDKMSGLPDSGEMAVRDAVSLCYTGMQLKENL